VFQFPLSSLAAGDQEAVTTLVVEPEGHLRLHLRAGVLDIAQFQACGLLAGVEEQAGGPKGLELFRTSEPYTAFLAALRLLPVPILEGPSPPPPPPGPSSPPPSSSSPPSTAASPLPCFSNSLICSLSCSSNYLICFSPRSFLPQADSPCIASALVLPASQSWRTVVRSC
jgi:hypothetical protein